MTAMPNRAATDEFAIERSHRAAAAANENSRVMVQSALLINGGAATAVIAFLSKAQIEPVLLRFVPIALAFYALGIFCAAVCAFFMTNSLDKWNEFWEFYARRGSAAARQELESAAERSWFPAQVAFGVSAFSFVGGCVALSIGLSKLGGVCP